MTTPTPLPPHEPLSAEERALALRLARLDAAAGPSAALDARILAAARAASGPVRAATRQPRRWPSAVGAAAVVVAAVGLAWQMRPMFDLGPAPIAREHSGAGRAGVESDVVVQVEAVPRAAPPPAEAVAAASDATAPSGAPRKAARSAGGGAVASARAEPAPGTAGVPIAHEHVFDEALPAAAAAPPQAPEPRALNLAAPAPPAAAEADLQRVTVTGSRVRQDGHDALPDLATDARLPQAAWLQRIRDRRDRDDIAGARTSLARFVAAHPRVAVPKDLQPLLRDDDPWTP